MAAVVGAIFAAPAALVLCKSSAGVRALRPGCQVKENGSRCHTAAAGTVPSLLNRQGSEHPRGGNAHVDAHTETDGRRRRDRTASDRKGPRRGREAPQAPTPFPIVITEPGSYRLSRHLVGPA